jgi:hypothetical protein
MTNHVCECCDFSTHLKANYERHIKSKKHFVSQKLALVSQTLASTLASSTTFIPDNPSFECEYCGQLYKHRSSLSKHIKYSCTKNKDEDLKELVRLLNLQLQEVKQEMAMKEEKHEKQIEKLMSKLQMQNCYNNNTVNNIKILAYKDTDFSHLTDQDYAFCIKQVNFCVKNMIEKVHFNPDKPENRNVYISNLKDKYLMVYEDGNWTMKHKKDILDTLYEEKEMLIEDWLEEEQHKYPELKKKFEKYLDNKENDETMNLIKEEIKLMMYNKAREIMYNP